MAATDARSSDQGQAVPKQAGPNARGDPAGTHPRANSRRANEAAALSSLFLSDLVDTLRSKATVIAAAIAEAVSREYPVYREVLDPLSYSRYLADTQRVLAMSIRGMSIDQPISPRDAAWLGGVAAQLASDGIPIESILASQRSALRAGWGQVIAEASCVRGEKAEALAALGTLAMALFDFMADLNAITLSGAAEVVTRAEDAGTSVLEELLAGSFASVEEITRRGCDVGHQLDSSHEVYVVSMPSEGSSAELAECLASAMPWGKTVIPNAPATPHLVLLAPCARRPSGAGIDAALGRQLAANLVVGIKAGPVSGATEIRQAYIDAVTLLGVVSRLLRGTAEPLAQLDQLYTFRLACTLPETERAALVTSVLGPILGLREHERDILIETLVALQAQGQPKALGKLLGRHHQTIRHRCQRIERLTGLRLEIPAHRLRLTLATCAYLLTAPDVGPLQSAMCGLLGPRHP